MKVTVTELGNGYLVEPSSHKGASAAVSPLAQSIVVVGRDAKGIGEAVLQCMALLQGGGVLSPTLLKEEADGVRGAGVSARKGIRTPPEGSGGAPF